MSLPKSRLFRFKLQNYCNRLTIDRDGRIYLEETLFRPTGDQQETSKTNGPRVIRSG